MNKGIGACVSLKSPMVGHLALAAIHILSIFIIHTCDTSLSSSRSLSLFLSVSSIAPGVEACNLHVEVEAPHLRSTVWVWSPIIICLKK
jgi:hypothetical protein